MYTKPDASEYPLFYATYIKNLPDAPFWDLLRRQQQELNQLLSKITDEQALQGYAPGKWSVKELLGHMIDTERIMGYRALCISRKEEQSLPGFDENQYMQNANFNQRSIADLLQEFNLVREATQVLLQHMTKEMVQRSGTANNNTVTVNALAYIIVGHAFHHANILKERYLIQ